jgi:uncharacterized integral membrane protein (TIGR00698 family)
LIEKIERFNRNNPFERFAPSDELAGMSLARSLRPALFPASADRLGRLLPGIALCVAVALAAQVAQGLEHRLFGRAWIEALVLAILLGAGVRTLWRPGPRFAAGVSFSAKTVLEIAVALLGASISAAAMAAAGPGLLFGIMGVVAGSLVGAYALCRALALPRRTATLVAAGNSICGNSAIAAVAPVIGAEGEEVATSIAFTAVLGVAVVLLLPLLAPLLHLSEVQYGVVAGLTVYAVPQVLAAAAPVGATALQVGTLVKLTRVLSLGPVVLILSLGRARREGGAAPKLHKLVPWFIVAFIAMAALRSAGALPQASLPWLAQAASILTVVSMAALGLGVDLRSVARAGPRVAGAVTLSLVLLLGLSLGLVRLLAIA